MIAKPPSRQGGCQQTACRRSAFTYIELLALLGIGVILLSIFIPYLTNVREQSRQTKCADNLRQLRDALENYALDVGNHDYPRVTYDPVIRPCGYAAFTGADAADPFSVTVAPSDVTASLWLLVRTGYVSDLSVFICPSSGDRADRLTDAIGRPVPVTHRSNFRSPINLSYSYASPFSGYTDYHLNSDVMKGQFALMADKNPGPGAAAQEHDTPPLKLAVGNSPNHAHTGQNVLYADGSVNFEITPYCGVGRVPGQADGDNIFTALASHPLAPGENAFYAGRGFVGRQYGPSYQYDSYLVPTAEDGN
jgi:prepilin-type processing-associated H-X9-DG protein